MIIIIIIIIINNIINIILYSIEYRGAIPATSLLGWRPDRSWYRMIPRDQQSDLEL